MTSELQKSVLSATVCHSTAPMVAPEADHSSSLDLAIIVIASLSTGTGAVATCIPVVSCTGQNKADPRSGLAVGGEQGEEGDGHESESPSGVSGPRIKAYSPTKTPGSAHSVVADSQEVSSSPAATRSHQVSLVVASP